MKKATPRPSRVQLRRRVLIQMTCRDAHPWMLASDWARHFVQPGEQASQAWRRVMPCHAGATADARCRSGYGGTEIR